MLNHALTKCGFVDKLLIFRWEDSRQNGDILIICKAKLCENVDKMQKWMIYWYYTDKMLYNC